MLCPKCGQEFPEELQACPNCPIEETVEEVTEATAEKVAEKTAEISAEETVKENEEVSEEPIEEPVEVSGETAEEPAEAAEEESEEAAEEETKKKKSPLAAILIVIIALLVIIVTCLGVALNKVSKGEELPSLSDIVESLKPDNYDPDAIAVTVTDANGNVVDELTNNEFAFYYWGEYYYYVNYYGLGFDATVDLDEQIYDESTGMTWHDYFVEMAKSSLTQIAVLKAEAESVNFVMPEDYQTEYQAVVDAMPSNAANTGFADENGNGDVLAYIQDSYGEDATVEEFEAYLYDSYYVSAYSDEIYYSFTYDDAALESYFDANADYFASYGIEKADTPNVNVRHILIEPVADEEGNISDEAWTTAENEADRILQEWKDGEATEETFAELANTYSVDPGSNTVGGLYEGVYPGQMVETFNDWCFDSARKTGDTDVVKTDYGYHIMYFVAATEDYYWKTVTDSEKRYEDYMATIETLTAAYTTATTEEVRVKDPDAVTLIRENAQADAEAAASTTDSAAG